MLTLHCHQESCWICMNYLLFNVRQTTINYSTFSRVVFGLLLRKCNHSLLFWFICYITLYLLFSRLLSVLFFLWLVLWETLSDSTYLNIIVYAYLNLAHTSSYNNYIFISLMFVLIVKMVGLIPAGKH